MSDTFDRINPHTLQVGVFKFFKKGIKRYYPTIEVRRFRFVFKKEDYKTSTDAVSAAKRYHIIWCYEYDRAKTKWEKEHNLTSLVGLSQEQRDMKVLEMMK